MPARRTQTPQRHPHGPSTAASAIDPKSIVETPQRGLTYAIEKLDADDGVGKDMPDIFPGESRHTPVLSV